MTDDLGVLGRLAGLSEDDFGYGRRLTELRDEMTATLGHRRTRELWKELSPIKRGRIQGERTYAPPALLVAVFDDARAHPDCQEWSNQKILDELGRGAHARWPLRFGATPAGISKSIGRALDGRAKREAEAKARAALLNRNLLADLLLTPDTKSGELLSETQKDGNKSPLRSSD